MASSISQGVVLTTAMLASSTVLYLAFSWQKITPLFQIHRNLHSHDSGAKMLRSCLYSEKRKRETQMTMKNKKKKKVQFADNVKEAAETEEPKQRRKKNRVLPSNNYRQQQQHETSEIPKMPANRIALYNGILRDRFHRMEVCTY